jgi:hypothetical protein
MDYPQPIHSEPLDVILFGGILFGGILFGLKLLFEQLDAAC